MGWIPDLTESIRSSIDSFKDKCNKFLRLYSSNLEKKRNQGRFNQLWKRGSPFTDKVPELTKPSDRLMQVFGCRVSSIFYNFGHSQYF